MSKPSFIIDEDHQLNVSFEGRHQARDLTLEEAQAIALIDISKSLAVIAWALTPEDQRPAKPPGRG